MDATQPATHRRQVVHFAQFLFSLAGARGYGTHRLSRMAMDRDRARGPAIPGNHGAFPSWLSWTRNFQLSLPGPAISHGLGYSGGAGEPDFHVAWHASAVANHSRLRRLYLLAVSREGARG